MNIFSKKATEFVKKATDFNKKEKAKIATTVI